MTKYAKVEELHSSKSRNLVHTFSGFLSPDATEVRRRRARTTKRIFGTRLSITVGRYIAIELQMKRTL